MTTDAPPLANIDRLTNVCTERLGFGADENGPRSEFVEPSEGV